MKLKITGKNGGSWAGPLSLVDTKNKILGMIVVRPFRFEDCATAIIERNDGSEMDVLALGDLPLLQIDKLNGIEIKHVGESTFLVPAEHYVRAATTAECEIDCCGDRYECNVTYVCSCGQKKCASCMKSHIFDLHYIASSDGKR